MKHLQSSCRHTSCPVHLHPHSCCRTFGRSWRPTRCRGRPPQPADPPSSTAKPQSPSRLISRTDLYKISVRYDDLWELYLFSVVGYRGQDGAQGFDAHGDVQQMTGEKEVVVVAKQWHDQIPNQIQERLRAKQNPNDWSLLRISSAWWNIYTETSVLSLLKLTLSVNTTPNFQIWYLMSIDVNLWIYDIL